MKPQQIEQTAKRYKATIALGVMMILAGFTWWIFGLATRNQTHSGDLMLVGILVYAVGRIAAWWNNG